MVNGLGNKITCPKCKKKYYSLEDTRPRCPNCAINDLIPAGTQAKVKLKIRPGGFDDQSQGWTAGLASIGNAGAVYLNCEFTVIEGPYAKRKIYSLIGLKSPKGPWWGNKGRTFIKNILNSAYGISETDQSPGAIECRKLASLNDIDGLEFEASISIGKDSNSRPKNEIEDAVVLADSKEYEEPSVEKVVSTTKQTESDTHSPLWLQ